MIRIFLTRSLLIPRDWFAVLLVCLALMLPGTLVLGGSINWLEGEEGSTSQVEEESLAASVTHRPRTRRQLRAVLGVADVPPLVDPVRWSGATTRPIVGHRIFNGLLAPLRI